LRDLGAAQGEAAQAVELTASCNRAARSGAGMYPYRSRQTVNGTRPLVRAVCARTPETTQRQALRMVPEESVMLARELFPVKTFENYFDRFEPFFSGEFMPRMAWPRKLDITAEWRPSADILETKDEYLVKAELPEVKKEDVKIEIVDGALTIRGERKLMHDQKKDTVHRVETFYGKFVRTFALPDNVDVAKIRAECADGVLTVHIPKTVTAMPKPIEIAVQ
jgi:HSP20 family protein